MESQLPFSIFDSPALTVPVRSRLTPLSSGGLTVAANIFAAHICQIAHGPEAQSNELVIERIELAEGRNVENSSPKHFEGALEGTLGGDRSTNHMGSLAIGYLQVVQPLTDELKWDEARFGLVARTNRVDRHFLRNPDKLAGIGVVKL